MIVIPLVVFVVCVILGEYIAKRILAWEAR